jgi:hypothetical protein
MSYSGYDRPRVLVEALSSRRQSHSSRVSRNEWHSEVYFEFLKMMAQRGLRDVQALRGGGERACVANCKEVTELPEIDSHATPPIDCKERAIPLRLSRQISRNLTAAVEKLYF